MNKVVKLGLIGIFAISLVTGCGCEKKKTETSTGEGNENQTVVENQIFEGLEFVNVGVSDGIIKTVVINNTGVVYEGSKFSMKIMDENGNVLKEITDEVKEPMETGTTKTIETKTNIDLSKAAAIEYSIIK